MTDRVPRRLAFCLLAACVLIFLALPAAAQVNQPQPAGSRVVAPPVLAKLLPALSGWTRGEVRLSQIEISADCKYTAACLPLINGDTRVKLTLADTGANGDALIALASMVITLADDCVQQIPPATTIKRLKIGEWQAAELWDAEKKAGEITVVVNGRFVVAIEGQKAESLDVLRAVLASVDLKALAALK